MVVENRKYYIEFVGTHGAGKTFTYHEITKKNLLEPHKSIYPGQINRPRLHFLMSCPIIGLKNIKHIIFVTLFMCKYSKINRLNFKIYRTLFKMIVLHYYYYRFNFDFYLKDDMLHIILRIIFKPKVDIECAFTEFFEFFHHLYDGLVFFDITSTTLDERFQNRFSGKTAAFIKSRLHIHQRSREQAKFLRRVLTTQRLVPIMVIDGGADVKSNADEIVSFIKTTILKT